MKKKLYDPENGPMAAGPYSPAVSANGFLFVSGQIPLNPENNELVDNSFEDQVRRVLENMQIILGNAGCSLNDVLKVTIYLEDLSNFDELNELYAEYFAQSKPARACIQAAKLPKGAAVEMDCIAMLPNQ